MNNGLGCSARGWGVGLAAGLLLLCLTATASGTADFISSPSEQGAPAFHHHLVRPGAATTYIIRVANIWTEPTDVKLNLIEPAQPRGSWNFTIASEQLAALRPGEVREVMVTVKPAASVKPGEAVQVMVTAAAANGATDRATLYAETTAVPKIYFVSIDSLNPEYLKLNAAATGPGKDGDWLMPNLHRLMAQSTFYPNNKVHIISATDMNHFNYLAGTMTGTSGIALVGAFFFGFDEQGQPIVKASSMIDQDLARYGNGQHVESIYNIAKKMQPGAYTAFISGKNWVPELYRFPEFGIDRIIHGQKMPEYIASPEPNAPAAKGPFRRAAKALLLPGSSRRNAHQLGNPAGNSEPQDKREQFWLARATGAMPTSFPPDAWVMDAAIKEIENEDPDVCYTLLAAVDDAGHAYGSAFDLSEWNDQGTPSLKDDVSKFDPRASRQGIVNVVRESDVQVGRFLDLLAARGQLDQAIIVLESDHAMVTGYKRAVDAVGHLKKAARKWSPKKDYFIGTAASVGMVALRPGGNPAALVDIEAALENWRVKNPVTGASECPVYVYNLEELKTGVDKKTGSALLLPREYYSEYYVEHRKPGDEVWADLFIMTKPNYKLSLAGFGLGNLGMSNLPFTLPRRGYFIGTHGSLETQTALLIVGIPGKPAAVNPAAVYNSDVAPTLYRILGWPSPPSVDGKGLPGLDPQLK